MPVRWVVAFWVLAVLLPFAVGQATHQEVAPTSQTQSSSSSKHGKQNYSHANDFLIRGTVFTEKALAFPGAELRIRRSGEKKFRWQDQTNSRGEFAIRVPQGVQYEMVVRAKGFAEQSRTIDASSGSGENNLVFRMQLAKKGKQ
jgi:hypothetical protein